MPTLWSGHLCPSYGTEILSLEKILAFSPWGLEGSWPSGSLAEVAQKEPGRQGRALGCPQGSKSRLARQNAETGKGTA